ncbi:MAG TPA: molybdopterin-dependent oxidoreductase [Tepidisphaeraceae bacterium]|jgi:DMSO/TMAO reductase YedYZ molybdopterin-dependent catalytic subunit
MDQSHLWKALASATGVDRRAFLRLTGAAGVGAMLAACEAKQQPASAAGGSAAGAAPSGARVEAANMSPGLPEPVMARFPEKTDLILLTDRPPQLETPIHYFKQDLTPNEAFFVRWHLADVPTSVDTNKFRLTVKGHVEHELSLSLDDLRKFDPVSVTAVNQCSGNSRGLFEPRVPGGQWGNGAVGNAKWTGVRLKDLLAKAGLKAGAVDVSFRGLDGPIVNTTPPFAKSLAADKANDPDVIIAYEMNGAPLPMLNGFPCRLIVPGWYATYWVKALHEITVLDKPFDGFWMAKAYRIAQTPNFSESPADLAKNTAPISVMTTRSLIVSPAQGDTVSAGRPIEIEGVAFDGGQGIAKVEISADGGKTWNQATLGPDLGRFSFRRFRYQWTPSTKGSQQLLSRATNNAGQTQSTHQWNRSGYARDVMDPTVVTVS